jgi:cytochrome c-type biogenesis protein CcmH
MGIHFKKIISVFFIVFFVAIACSSLATAGAVLSDLENQLMCKCDDKCGKVLINCTCSTAAKTRKKFTKMLETGLTVEQIIQQQVTEYGETVLSAPTKTGFNLTAWVMPFGALLVGGLGLRRLLNVWAVNGKSRTELPDNEVDGTSGAGNDKSGDASSSKYSHHLQDELNRLET